MSENESRNERKKAEQEQAPKNKGSLNKVYYWIIGILFIILFLLVVYIFVSSGDKVNLEDTEESSSVIEDIETAPESEPDAQEEAESVEDTTDQDTENVTEESTDDSEEIVDEEISLSENAPLDTGYVVDYNTGSADRQAIKEKVMQATGLGDDLIENWIGNNGPGRVTADVHSPNKSEVYRVYLQYGEGAWHVTNYESLSSVPEN